MGFAGGDTNLFGYVGNNPIMFVDPLGTFPEYLTPSEQTLYNLAISSKAAAYGTLFFVEVNPLIPLGFSAVSLGASSLKSIMYGDNPGRDLTQSTVTMAASAGLSPLYDMALDITVTTANYINDNLYSSSPQLNKCNN